MTVAITLDLNTAEGRQFLVDAVHASQVVIDQKDETIRDLVAALCELLEAMVASASADPSRDDVTNMIRYGHAEDAARAALAKVTTA